MKLKILLTKKLAVGVDNMTNYTYEQRLNVIKPKLNKIKELCQLAIDDIYYSPNSEDFIELLELIQDKADDLTKLEVISE